MKKSKIKTVLILLIIMGLCLSVGVYAGYTLSATDVTYTKSDGTTLSVSAALDELRAGLPTKSIGDEVTVGGEQFYVLDWNNNSPVALLMAKYNLNVGGTAQQDASQWATAVQFADSKYWSNETSYPLNLNDLEYTLPNGLVVAKRYGRSKGAVSSRMLTYEEATELISKSNSNSKIAYMIWGRANTQHGFQNYWIASAQSSDYIYDLYAEGGCISFCEATNHWNVGIRPVITILKTKIS